MNWAKLLTNVVGVAIAAAGACWAKESGGGAVAWGSLATCTVIGVVANLIGLFQQPPHQG